MLRVDIGCGTNKPLGFIGVDSYPAQEVDIVADLTGKFPFKDNSVDELRAYDIIEHLPDRIHTMNEIWRVCKAGAKVDIRVPSTDGRGAFQDPTHISFWNINSFYYYCVQFPSYLELCQRYGFQGEFKALKLENELSDGEVVHVQAILEVIKSGLESKTLENQIATSIHNNSDNQQDVKLLINKVNDDVRRYFLSPDYISVLADLRNIRRQLAEFWLSCNQDELSNLYQKNWGELHRMIFWSNIKYEILTVKEQEFVDNLVENIQANTNSEKLWSNILAISLYYRADQFPLDFQSITNTPHWYLKDYLQFLLYYPVYFSKSEDADNYYKHFSSFVDFIHNCIINDPDDSFSLQLAQLFVDIHNMMPIYFNEKQLKEIYVQRAEIIEFVLNHNQSELNYQFTSRSKDHKKIRIGILATHFLPLSETFASLPIYEYLSREFEVILYSFYRTNHPLEQYCENCASSFKILSGNLSEQVINIRNDDLDILFIGTNITASANKICLLSFHRLARIQITSVACVVTTGIREIDYFISGEKTDPMETADLEYQEKLIKLDEIAHCFSFGLGDESANITVNRDSLGITSSDIVYISDANCYKITPQLIDAWTKIIASVPNSILLLLPFGPNWADNYPKINLMNYLNTKFAEKNILPGRLIILDPQPIPNRAGVKEYMKIADIYLDSLPVCGTTSLIEPLEVGLPVISYKGKSFRSSMGAAMLETLNIPDLVANSIDSYIDLAINLGVNNEKRQRISHEILERIQKQPIFLDSRNYAKKIEKLFHELIKNYEIDNFSEKFFLRDINFIILPNWSESEDILWKQISEVIKAITIHQKKDQITLLIEHHNISEEDINFIISSITMNLIMEEDLEISENLQISLLGELSDMQWQILIPKLKARIILESENQEQISQVKLADLMAMKIDDILSYNFDA